MIIGSSEVGAVSEVVIQQLAGIVGASAVVLVGYMFLSARAISVWNGPRTGPRWATFFGYFDPSEVNRIKRRAAYWYAALAGLFELGIAYPAVHPELLPMGGSLVFAVQIAFAIGWATYFWKLPRGSWATEVSEGAGTTRPVRSRHRPRR